MSVEITVMGEPGEALSFDGTETLALVAPRAFAPGTPIEMRFRVGESAHTIRGKARGSRRRDDGRYDVQARLISLRREQRLALRRALPG